MVDVRSLCIRLAVLAFLVAIGRPALAEPATLAQAEQAYADVDFERAHELSSEALHAGAHSVAETRRLYTLLGVSGAALGREDIARQAFVRVLLSEPGLKLDQSLSPKLRAPYLEARGLWASATAERGLQATLEIVGDFAVLELFDPMGAVHGVELSTERPGSQARETHRLAPKPQVRVRTGAFDRYEIRLLDEYGNALLEARGQTAAAERPPASPGADARTEPPNRTPYYVVASGLGILGVGAVAGGVAFQLEREQAAEEWNSASCEEPGATRAEQCADVDDRRRQAELFAIGFYATGAAFLVGGLVTLAVVPGEPDEDRRRSTSMRCNPTLGVFGLSCRGRF
jgi:hypothetical protein